MSVVRRYQEIALLTRPSFWKTGDLYVSFFIWRMLLMFRRRRRARRTGFRADRHGGHRKGRCTAFVLCSLDEVHTMTQHAGFYQQIAEIVGLPPQERHRRLAALHADVVAGYCAAVQAIDAAAATRP